MSTPTTPATSTPLTGERREIVHHAKRTGRYVADENEDMKALVADGWLRDHGPQALAGGAHYYTPTSKRL